MADPTEPLDPNELVIVLLGGSAVGKSTLAVGLTEAGIVQPTPTWATRTPRPGEESTCYDHHFVTDGEFDRYSREGGFIDEQALYGGRYGVPLLQKPPADKEALIVLKPLFIPAFIAYYPNARIHQIEAPEELIEGRMLARGQSKEDIAERKRLYPEEVREARRFAHATFTNDGSIQEMVETVIMHIRADRQAHDAAQAGQT